MTAVHQSTQDLLHYAKTAETRRHRKVVDEERARELRILSDLLSDAIDVRMVA